MEVLKLIAVFAAIILILRMKRPLWLALCCGALATVALYGLSPLETPCGSPSARCSVPTH